MSITTTLNLFELLYFKVHLDSTTYVALVGINASFTVNDIITGWVEIVSAKQRMESMTLSLVREELFFFYGGSVVWL